MLFLQLHDDIVDRYARFCDGNLFKNLNNFGHVLAAVVVLTKFNKDFNLALSSRVSCRGSDFDGLWKYACL